MSNITTDLESFENIDYPKSIYELLLNLKDKPLDINVNCGGSSNPNTQNSSYNKYSSEEILLRIDPVFGEIYTKTIFFTDSYQDVPTSDIEFEFQIHDLDINNILDLSIILNVKRFYLFTIENQDIIRYLTKIYDLHDFFHIKDKGASIVIPITEIENYFSIIYTQGVYQETSLDTFITLVYTKNTITP